MKFKELEALMVKHLKESGNIKTDLAWLKTQITETKAAFLQHAAEEEGNRLAHLTAVAKLESSVTDLKDFAKDAKDLPSDMKWVKRALWTLLPLMVSSFVAIVCAWMRQH